MSGFLVEVTPGREVVYRTTWALREAIRSGEIRADSRLFHRASSQWLPITEHPEYRRFLADPGPPARLRPAPPEPAEWVPPDLASGGLLTELSHRAAAAWRVVKRRLGAGTTRSRATPRRPPSPKVPSQARPPVPPTEGPDPPRSSPPRRHWTYLP
ncbi:MAG: hypothetical protein ACREM9_04450 [Gemmatimonadales bacterium]